MAGKVQRAVEAGAGGVECFKCFGVALGGCPQTLQGIGAPAKLLENGVVGDSPQLAGVRDPATGCCFRTLPCGWAGAGAINQGWAKSPQQGRVAGVSDQPFMLSITLEKKSAEKSGWS